MGEFQLFIIDPRENKTRVLSVKHDETLKETVETIECVIKIPSRYFYILWNGRHLDVRNATTLSRSLSDIGIQKEDTLRINPRFNTTPRLIENAHTVH